MMPRSSEKPRDARGNEDPTDCTTRTIVPGSSVFETTTMSVPPHGFFVARSRFGGSESLTVTRESRRSTDGPTRVRLVFQSGGGGGVGGCQAFSSSYAHSEVVEGVVGHEPSRVGIAASLSRWRFPGGSRAVDREP